MDFYAVELPGRAETVVVDDLAVADVHAGDALHFLCSQFKIKNIQIFRHPLPMDCLGNNGDISLEVPAQNDLGRCFPVLLRNSGQYFMVENITLSLGEWPQA